MPASTPIEDIRAAFKQVALTSFRPNKMVVNLPFFMKHLSRKERAAIKNFNRLHPGKNWKLDFNTGKVTEYKVTEYID